MADPRVCRNPDCDSEFGPASWLDPVFCSYDCRVAWCLANGRDRADELVGPPIVHPAGVIPAKVEQRVSEQIAAKRQAADLVAFTEACGFPLSKWQAQLLTHDLMVPNLCGPAPREEVEPERWFARLRKRWLG
jgi:hypothetical protein